MNVECSATISTGLEIHFQLGDTLNPFYEPTIFSFEIFPTLCPRTMDAHEYELNWKKDSSVISAHKQLTRI